MPPIEKKTCPSNPYEKVMDSSTSANHCARQNESADEMNWTIDDPDARNTEEQQTAVIHTKPHQPSVNHESDGMANLIVGNQHTTDEEDAGKGTESGGMSPARFSARFFLRRKTGRNGRAVIKKKVSTSGGKKKAGRTGKMNRNNTDSGSTYDDHGDDLVTFGNMQESGQEDNSEDQKRTDEVLEEWYGKSFAHSEPSIFTIIFNEAYEKKKRKSTKKKSLNQVSADFDDQGRENFTAQMADIHQSQHYFQDFDIHRTIASAALRHTLPSFSFSQVASAIIAAGTSDPFQKEVRIRIKDSVLKGTEVCIRREVQKLLITETEISFKQLTMHCENFKFYMRRVLGMGKHKSKKNKFDDFDEIEVEIEKIDQLPSNPFM